MDKNTIIGMLLIMVMLLGYNMLSPTPETPKTTPQAKAVTKPTALQAPAKLDSVTSKALYGDFAKATQGIAKDIVIENEDTRITFSSLGGGVKEVLLKKYKTFEQKPLYLIDSQSSRFNIDLPSTKGNVNLSNLYFETDAQNKILKAGESAKVTFRLPIAANQFVEQSYTIQGTGYVVDYDLKLNGLDALVKNEAAKLIWTDALKQFENDLTENRKVVTTNYFADNSMSDIGKGQTENKEEKIEEPVSWFTHKNKYFLTGLISKNTPMTAITAKSLVDDSDSSYVKTMQTEASLSMSDLKSGKGNFQFYFGPNDFQIVKEVKAANFDDNVDLGYAFLKPLNKYFFVPLFSFLEKYFSNYGILIIVLVLFVKLLMTPLVYKSYISMAKMRVLAPELAVIKEKVGDDQTKMQQEQMKLYQQVGVSPLSGCVPVLATMPILMSLFFLFPNLIELRQQAFLWAKDLSTYDAPIHLPFTIPFYGSHVSIFTLLMTISQVIYAWYNNQMTPTQTQPGMPNMKVMGYIMPVMFMFIMNSFPAGLSFYYFISNLVTIAQQQIIRRFVDEDKLKVVLDENRVKIASGTKKQSKFSAMFEKSMKAAEEAKKQAEDAKKKSSTKKK
jgi:YidC/Oxa1 family membrane protein insertase